MNNWHALFIRLCDVITAGDASQNPFLKAVLALFAACVGWLILKRLLSAIEKGGRRVELLRVNPQSFDMIRKMLFYGFVLMAGTYLIRLAGIRPVEKAFYAILVILVAQPAKVFLVIVLTYLEDHIAAKTDTKIDNIIFELLNKFAAVIIYSTAVVLALDLLGINVMPFVAGAGVAGIAVGFAAKDTLSNLIAGVLLIIDRPFEIGDRIEVWSAPQGTATWGDVIDIGLRATKIRTTDHLVIVIPNNEIMKRDIVNYTLISSEIRVRIDIGVAYDADIKKAKATVLKVADTAGWILKQPAPTVVVRKFGESSVDLQLRVWIGDARKRMNTISYVTDKVKEAFDSEGIEIPYPKRDIFIRHREAGGDPTVPAGKTP